MRMLTIVALLALTGCATRPVVAVRNLPGPVIGVADQYARPEPELALGR